MSDTSEHTDPVLPEAICRKVHETLEDSAVRFLQLVETLPEQPPPQLLARAISAVLDSFDDVARILCGKTKGVSRHPSCRVDKTAIACPPPLRLAFPEANAICATFGAEEERLNLLVDAIKHAAPEVDFKDWGPVFAQAMGAIYIEILRPLRHQHPELNPSHDSAP